jgi:tRNA A-37 threonylcarbamoyl transferase component Bud32
MQGSLGEKIGEGAFSEAYAWAPGQVVKLFKAGISRRFGRHEVRMIRAVLAAGLPVPEVFGEVTLDGRFGIVLQRLDGPTLWQLSRTGAVTFEQAGAIVAALAMSIHKTTPPAEVPTLREHMEDALRRDDGKLPKRLATDVLALVGRLPPGDGLCHCDLSPGNVIMTAEGPKLVDWTFAMRAPAAVELGFLHVILSELAPEIADNPQRPRATNAAAQSGYARLAGMSLEELTAAVKPYLPIVRTFVLLGDVVPSLRQRLIQRIDAGLRPEH